MHDDSATELRLFFLLPYHSHSLLIIFFRFHTFSFILNNFHFIGETFEVVESNAGNSDNCPVWIHCDCLHPVADGAVVTSVRSPYGSSQFCRNSFRNWGMLIQRSTLLPAPAVLQFSSRRCCNEPPGPCHPLPQVIRMEHSAGRWVSSGVHPQFQLDVVGTEWATKEGTSVRMGLNGK